MQPAARPPSALVKALHSKLLLADGRVARMEGVGHPLHVIDAAPILAAMVAFLDEVLPRS